MSSNTPGSSGGSSRPYNDLPSYDSGPSSSGQGPASFKPGASHGSGGSAYGSATPGAASSGSPAYGSSSYGSSPSDYGSSQSSTYGGGDYSSGNYGAPGYPVRRPTNGLAIAALVLGIISILSTYPIGIIGIAPVIMGHIALKQCKERDQEGKGLAIAGLITGYLAIAGFVVIVLFIILMIGLAGFSSY